MKNRIIDTDVLIIGGGTAGCFAGITLGGKKDLDVLIVEKANIVRSGCLAAGVNAINAYITKAEFHRIMLIIVRRCTWNCKRGSASFNV